MAGTNTGITMLLKTFGLDPKEMLANVDQFRGLVLQLVGSQQAILANQRAIMDALNIGEKYAPGHIGHSGSVEHSGRESVGTGNENLGVDNQYLRGVNGPAP